LAVKKAAKEQIIHVEEIVVTIAVETVVVQVVQEENNTP
jgi:hypothetical protein